MKSVEIRTRKNSVFGHFSRSAYCYEPEKDAEHSSESSGSDSDTIEDESSEEEKISPNNVEINRAGYKD